MSRARVAFTLVAKGHEQSRCERRSGTGEGVEQNKVGVVSGALRNLLVELFDGAEDHPQLGDRRLCQKLIRRDDRLVSGQRSCALDGADPPFNERGRAHVVGVEEALKYGTKTTIDLVHCGTSTLRFGGGLRPDAPTRRTGGGPPTPPSRHPRILQFGIDKLTS